MFPIVLIWASERQDSLALRLYLHLKNAGFNLFPINPKYKTIVEDQCFSSLDNLPILPQVVVFMVNPKLTLQILPQVVDLRIKKVWFQPWTFDDEVVAFCEKNRLDYENEKCLLISPIQVLEEFVKR